MKLEWVQKTPRLDYSPFDDITDILAAINGVEDVERFLNPTSQEVHDPFLFKNIELARDRIVQAIENGEKIAIHLDNDADGIFSGTITYRYLNNFTNSLEYFYSERSLGHGVDVSLDDLPEDTDLLIIVDSSSSLTKTCKRIKENKNIDIIIIDHHELSEPNPYCILVNPQQEGCNYPNKNVSGGLACWKMAQVLDRHFNTYYANEFVDLAGLSAVADAMNMMNYENRYIAKRAIENIHNIGLKTLIKVTKKDLNNFTCTDFLFGISPCITAATRFDKLEIAFRLLLSDDVKECVELANQLIELNEQRKKIQDKSVERLISLIGEQPTDKCIVVVDPSIGKGFNGVVANDLATYYQRPAFVFGETEYHPDEYRGSYRSYGDFNMLEFLDNIPEALFAGGHPSAGGSGVKKHVLENFKRSLNEGLKDKEFKRVIEYDYVFSPNEITESLIHEIENFYRICGNGFQSGKFLVTDLYIDDEENVQLLGKTKNTVKIQCDGLTLMKFKTNEEYKNNVPIQQKFEVVGTLNVNSWFNPRFKKEIKTNQLFISDYREVN